jgi:ADP-heptose:LPS heptosyltransferase
VDDVLVFDKRRLTRDPRRMRAFVSRLRDARYDLALVLSSVDFSTTAVGLAAISGAARRAGRPGAKESEQRIARDAFHWVLPAPPADRHQSAAHLDLVAAFGAPWTDGSPEIFLTKEEEKRGAQALSEAVGTGQGGLSIVLHPGAGKIPNRWDAAGFGQVAVMLESEGHSVVATAGPKETALLDRLDQGAGKRIARLAPLSIRELAGALRGAHLVLANDTGVLYVAAATGTPALGLFGPTDPRLWCPASPRVFTLRAPGGDLAKLSVDEVAPRVLALARCVATGAGFPAGLEPAPRVAP